MSHPTVSTRASRIAALVAIFALLVGALPVRAARSIQIDAHALVGGRYAVGGWLAISVTLVNEGAPTEGYLEADSDGGTVQRFVEMPAGARKATALYVRPEAFARNITVRYLEPNGTVEAEVPVRVLEQSAGQLAIGGDPNGMLRAQLAGTSEFGAREPIQLNAADIPERPEPLSGISALVWAGDSTALSEGQRRSLERWVANGGQLVLVGGPDWQARTEAFADLLPVESLAADDAVPHAALASWSGAGQAPRADDTVSTGALRDGGRALVTTDDDRILVSMRSVGAGRVILIGTDLATDAYRDWDGAPRLWDRLLDSGADLQEFFGGMPPREEIEMAIGQALGNLPSLEVPSAELLLAVIVAYIVLIGPISYIVLRRLDRREMAWVTAPLLVVLFAGCSYGIGSAMKGGDVIVNQISLIRSSGDGSTASVESYSGIFSPDRRTYDINVEGDALVAQLRNTQGFNPGARRDTGTVVEQGNPAGVRGLAIGVFGFEGIRADALVEHEPSLAVSWRMEDGAMIGTVTNHGEELVEDVAYVSQTQGEMVGDLEPGASTDFRLESNNFNGSSASDQVYGFGGFDVPEAEQRRSAMRRQVIDSLVGYAGFAPGAGWDFSSSTGRGPYVIGWIADDGPLAVTVDGADDAQRYNTSVEVLSIRPVLPAGNVTISPLQMSLSISELDGDAAAAGPGMVNIGEGSAIFGIALPLEATDMAVETLEITAGQDPMMVMDQGAAGFFPDGYTIEVRNPTTGEWTVLGDLGDQSRYAIEDPASAMSSTGRIEVRVSGGEVDRNFGPISFFVSAEVEGVIAE